MNRPANEHGGDWAAYETEYGREPLDFSMNVNPLGMSDKAKAAITAAAEQAERYPDPACRQLRGAIAKAEGVRADQIFCGAGAADIIYRLAKAAKPAADDGTAVTEVTPKLLITAPTFSEYEEAFASEGWKVDRWVLDESSAFRLGEEFIGAISSGVDAVFLCEPNNPTGVATERGLLERILQKCQETETMLILDECFNGFLDEPEAHTMKSHLQSCENLIILKAFTKLYGMAGVRLGYCLCADQALIDRLTKAGPPWNVSSLAQAAGMAALEDEAHVAAGREIVKKERTWLMGELSRIGCNVIPSQANYILFRGSVGLDQVLRRRGVLIRNCDNYYGLGEGWFRIAVKTHKENELLIETLTACAAKGCGHATKETKA